MKRIVPINISIVLLLLFVVQVLLGSKFSENNSVTKSIYIPISAVLDFSGDGKWNDSYPFENDTSDSEDDDEEEKDDDQDNESITITNLIALSISRFEVEVQNRQNQKTNLGYYSAIYTPPDYRY